MSDQSPEFPNTREATSQELASKIEEGVTYFLSKIEREYGYESFGPRELSQEYPREFHKRNHTEDLLRNADLIEQAITEAEKLEGHELVPREQLLLARLYIAAHDSVVDKDERGNNLREYNEKQSVLEVMEWMKAANANQDGIVYFKPIHFSDADDAITSTIPGFSPINKEDTLFTVTQPYLKPEYSYSAYIVAMCDLGDPGSRGYDSIFQAGIQLAIEDNSPLQISRRLLHDYAEMKEVEQPSENFESKREVLVKAIKFQYGFALGQQARFDKLVRRFPDSVQDKLKQKFNRYEDTVREAREVYKSIDSLDTLEVFQLAFGSTQQHEEIRHRLRERSKDIDDMAIPQVDSEMLRNLP